MKCKHRGRADKNIVVGYVGRPTSDLRNVIASFNAPVWRKCYGGDHRMQAYRQMFFKLARERGIHLGS